MKTLVTGGAGAIGLHLSRFLFNKGKDLVILDNLFGINGKIDSELEIFLKNPRVEFINVDLCDSGFKQKLGKNKFDKVYHLASINGTSLFYKIPDKILKDNILGTINLLDWFSECNNNGKILLTASCEAYAGTVSSFGYKVPTDEKVPLCIEDVKNPRWSYGLSKLVQETLFINYSKQRKFNMGIARVHNAYGERMGLKHVIPQFIQRVMQKQDPFKIYGADDTRSFCYVGDTVEAIHRIMESDKCNGEIINVGDDKNELLIKDLALKILDIAGYYPKIKECSSPEGSVKRRCPSIIKLRDLTGFENKVSLDKGLQRTYNWYKSNYSKSE